MTGQDDRREQQQGREWQNGRVWSVGAWVAVLLLVLCSGGSLSWPRRPPTWS